MTADLITTVNAIAWLNEAACYFERRPTKGEDAARWSNVTNAETARRIAKLLEVACNPLGEKFNPSKEIKNDSSN
ncbi:hypothetical protein [Caulobacter phage Cr30]|uniref:hypothetical protein n=1 Tax=Caulobacter phage Cr30 TaxID=1357714 RepID=UPI0004A9B39D|nr:hypothetical protein OZ74_gp018 [Caulobacter phage Cr30]AGS80903.1 hypothetical protein [Caulobacter phage Cr30]